ncbi:hypothetical protein ACC736_39975, partial [Rhizobium ruizarguesonis]
MDWWKKYDAKGRVIARGTSPVLLELNGDGHVDLRTLDSLATSVGFDWDGDGVADESAWVGP